MAGDPGWTLDRRLLPLPDLDDRRWQDLVEEGRALIPFYAPELDRPQRPDPGITLMELFAWLAEMDLFTLNQITDAQRRKFLALVGVEGDTRPPRAGDSGDRAPTRCRSSYDRAPDCTSRAVTPTAGWCRSGPCTR